MKCKNLFVEYFSTVCTSALLLRTDLMALLAERAWYTKFQSSLLFLGSLRYGDYTDYELRLDERCPLLVALG